MRKVIVLPKYAFDRGLAKENITDSNVENFKEKVCFISINDSMGTDEIPYFKEEHSNVLTLFFDDVDNDIVTEHGTARVISDEQAKQIFDFVTQNKECRSFIVHCTAGISRSGAVGEFINDMLGLDFNQFKLDNPYTHPNGIVLSKLKRFLWGFE